MANGSKNEDLGAARRVTLAGSAINLALVVLKLVAGTAGRSQALIADAFHSLSDLISDAVVLAGIALGAAPADKRHHFGHARLETLAAATLGLGLVGTAVWLGYRAGLDIEQRRYSDPAWFAAAAAGLSLVVKEALYRYTMVVSRRVTSAALRANAWHHRSDALSSLAVLVGVGAAAWNPAWRMADAYAAFLVSFFVLAAGLDVIWDAVKELTDTAPDPKALAEMEACALSVPGVLGVHDLRVRLSGGRFQLELHVVVDGSLTVRQGHVIAKEVEHCLLDNLALVEKVIIHIDPQAPPAREA